MANDKLLKIFGTEEIVKIFTEMDSEIKKKILFVSFKKAAKLIIDAASSNLGGSYKEVKNSLGFKYNTKDQGMKVGTQRKSGGQLANIIEGGTKERYYKTKEGNIHRTGKIMATNFFKKSINNTEKNVEEIIYTEIIKRFNEIINKNNNTKK